MSENTKQNGGDTVPRIAFDYIKSQQFRVIRADGAFGGITPRGFIHFSLYSERRAIPRREVYAVEGDQLGQPIQGETVSRDSIVREMDCDVFVTIEAAESIGNWLLEKAALAKKQAAEVAAKQASGRIDE